MPAAPRLSDRTLGIAAAFVTVRVGAAFVVIARASAAHSPGAVAAAPARAQGARRGG